MRQRRKRSVAGGMVSNGTSSDSGKKTRTETSKSLANWKKPKIVFSFTDTLQQKMKEVHGGLFTKDFVWCNSPELLAKQTGSDVNHDLELLRLTPSSSREEMRAAFERLKIYRWLDGSVETELYFGELTKKLHTDLQDDPKPYRKSVKILLANLINWTTFLFPDRFRQERPNYSTKIVRI